MSESAVDIVGDIPTVCIDFKSPKAYLALAPTFALEDKLGMRFDWLPVSVSPMTRPAAKQPNEDRGTQHRRMRGEYYERDLRRYAHAYGLELSDLYRNPDTTLAGVGLMFVRRDGHAAVRRYLHLVFERYWNARLDIEDARAIAAALAGADVATFGWDEFAAGAGRDEYEHTVRALREGGVFDVPAYVVGGDVFFGRQHLPMIEWLLTGRSGEPPL